VVERRDQLEALVESRLLPKASRKRANLYGILDQLNRERDLCAFKPADVHGSVPVLHLTVVNWATMLADICSPQAEPSFGVDQRLLVHGSMGAVKLQTRTGASHGHRHMFAAPLASWQFARCVGA